MRRPFFHHHKHTGKLIHHRHTSYPILFTLAVIVGGLILLTGRVAQADDLFVSATIPAPIPAGAPTFTSPDDGSSTTNNSVNFTGTCPVITPAVIIALYDGSTLLGSGLCQTDGTFAVAAALAPGAHAVVATVVTITNDTGESSLPLHIIYTPPTVPISPSEPTAPQAPDSPSSPSSPSTPAAAAYPTDSTIAPLDIISEKPFITFHSNRLAEWSGRFAGGTTPYTVTIQWGDGTQVAYPVGSNDLQVFSHQYNQNRVYIVSITTRDSKGATLKRNYVAMQSNGAPVASTSQSTLASMIDSTHIDPYIGVFSVYSCLLATMLMMWRYEHAHYPYRVIGVQVRYAWQKPTKKRR